MTVLMIFGTMPDYLTRNTVAAAAPALVEKLNISIQRYPYIIAAYSAAYTVMQPVAGYVLDMLGTKIGCATFAVLWAVFCGITVLAGSRGGLAVARGAAGAAEAAMIPADLKTSSEWFPAKERSIAIGYFNVGSSIGVMIAPPLMVQTIVIHSWQMAFTISGALSSIWVMTQLIFYEHPCDQKHSTDEERDYIINDQGVQHQVGTAKKMFVGRILRSRQFWGIALPRFLTESTWDILNVWIPLFMFKAYGFNLKEITMSAWMPMLFIDLGCILGDYLPSLSRHWLDVNLIVSRRMVITLGAVLMIGPGMIGPFTNPYVVIMLLCIGGFTHQALSDVLITFSSDVFSRNEVATTNGLTGISAWLVSTLFALVVGALADTISSNPLFAVLAVFDLLGVLVIWTVLQSKPAIKVAQGPHNDPTPQR